MSQDKKQTYKLGLIILIVLAVLTAIEFGVATAHIPWVWIFFLLALIKAWFVLQYYMHLPRLFKAEQGE
jgi:heme/copper-type cytochrome/quinol oxidase subunit 4